MISAKAQDRQLKRLAALSFFPTTEEAVSDLAAALNGADSDAIAEQVVSLFVFSTDGSTECPKAPELARAIRGHSAAGLKAARDIELREARDKAEWKPNYGPPGCAECNDTGFVSRDVDGIAKATRCDCKRNAVTA